MASTAVTALTLLSAWHCSPLAYPNPGLAASSLQNLARCKLLEAEAVFILANRAAASPEQEDVRNTMTALALGHHLLLQLGKGIVEAPGVGQKVGQSLPSCCVAVSAACKPRHAWDG